jgi:hypothetical protein
MQCVALEVEVEVADVEGSKVRCAKVNILSAFSLTAALSYVC